MLARRTAFVALIYTEDDDPRVSMNQDFYGVTVNGEYNLKATVSTVATSLEEIEVVWQRRADSESEWADAPTGTGYSASFVTTASGARSGITQYTITQLASGDLGDYRVKVTGAITDPYYSSLSFVTTGG